MNITLQCHYCGNEDVKLAIEDFKDDMTIKCKCGKWLVKNGIMGHKHNSEREQSNDR
jgi:hypothetical protein